MENAYALTSIVASVNLILLFTSFLYNNLYRESSNFYYCQIDVTTTINSLLYKKRIIPFAIKPKEINMSNFLNNS